jgi:hypothetical protein
MCPVQTVTHVSGRSKMLLIPSVTIRGVYLPFLRPARVGRGVHTNVLTRAARGRYSPSVVATHAI